MSDRDVLKKLISDIVIHAGGNQNGLAMIEAMFEGKLMGIKIGEPISDSKARMILDLVRERMREYDGNQLTTRSVFG